MKVKYWDSNNQPHEVSGLQFYEDYYAGATNNKRKVIINDREEATAAELIAIIAEPIENNRLDDAYKAKLEEEEFQKTAPWWLKANFRRAFCSSLILTPLMIMIYCINIADNFDHFPRVLFFCVTWLPFFIWSLYWFNGGMKYRFLNGWSASDDYRELRKQIATRRMRRRMETGNDAAVERPDVVDSPDLI